MSTVLLVDATEEMRPLASALEGAGYAVLSRALAEVLTGEDEDTPDVLILNLTSADADAAAVRALLRSESMPHGVAAIALVRQGQLAALDFSLGCDDFLVYPATAEELAARVRRAIWMKSGIWSDNTLRADDLMMDLANYQVYVAGRPIDLTYKEYELLRFLATNRGKVFTREALLSRVWGYDFYGGARTVDVHIRRLRSKIEDRTHVFIETVRNVGYRFKA